MTIDFMVRLQCTTNGYDSIREIVDRLAKSAHYLPIKTTHTMALYTQLYVDKIVRLHGVLVSTVSDRGTKFTSHF